MACSYRRTCCLAQKLHMSCCINVKTQKKSEKTRTIIMSHGEILVKSKSHSKATHEIWSSVQAFSYIILAKLLSALVSFSPNKGISYCSRLKNPKIILDAWPQLGRCCSHWWNNMLLLLLLLLKTLSAFCGDSKSLYHLLGCFQNPLNRGGQQMNSVKWLVGFHAATILQPLTPSSPHSLPGNGLNLYVTQQFWTTSVSQGNFIASLHQVISHAIRNDRVIGIIRMWAEETS